MNTTEERKAKETQRDEHGGDSMFGMMAMMMAMCAGVLLLAVLLPTLGFPLGLLIALGAVALMFLLHARFIKHGGKG